MTRWEYGWLILPSVLLLGFAPLVGSDQLLTATIAVLLTLPASGVCCWWVRRIQQVQPRGAILAILAGKLLKFAIALGGGCAVFFGWERESANGLALWLWIAVAYLSTLTAEVFLLARPGWVGRSIVSRNG